MAFRRYGGDFSFRGDGSNSKFAFIGVLLFIASVFASIFLSSPGLIVLGLLVMFFFTGISTFLPGGATSGIKGERFKMHIERAIESYENEDYEAAKESFRRAKIHGKLPKKYKSIYEKLGVNA